ncbi:hypothetical protein Tco_1490766, partial [Tanacetum coccineum]
MEDPNLTMEEYIRIEEEKAHKREKVFNWQTATYGKIRVDDDLHNLSYVETEFPAIVFNDTLTSEATLSCEPMVSSLNNDEIDFRISFDESDDEDCTILRKNFQPLYKEAQTSKSDLLTEPILNPQHIDEFNLKDETSLSECDEEEQNVLNFNDLFPFNVIYPDELKTDTDNDNDKVDIEHSSGDLSVKPLPDLINTDVGAYAHGSNKLLETSTVFREPPYLFDYPMRRLTMEEILAKFIDEGRREHEEMEIFIKEFRTTNELLLKTQSNLLSGLKIEVNKLSKVVSNVLIPKNEVKGVTTRRGKITSEATRSKEINEIRINENEPPRFEQDVQEKPHDYGEKNKS